MTIFMAVLLLASIAAGRGAPSPLESRVSAVRDTSFVVVNSMSTAYRIGGVNNPTLSLIRGQTCYFYVTAPGHPFYIKSLPVAGTGSRYDNGVTGQGTQSGTVTFVVPMDAPTDLHYHCSVHSSMGGNLYIVDPVGLPGPRLPAAAWLGPAVPNPARDGAAFSLGLPRRGTLELGLFDPRGRKVRELARGTHEAGEHAIPWDGRDGNGRHLAPGVYYYRLRFEDTRLGGRLVVRP